MVESLASNQRVAGSSPASRSTFNMVKFKGAVAECYRKIMKILRLDSSGNPINWIHKNDAVTLYFQGQVLWEIGARSIRIRGGINRNGSVSVVKMAPVIASAGIQKVLANPFLDNDLLFRRDNFMCMYCGHIFHRSLLSRDHIHPASRGGPDTWMNTVTACKRCNNAKADRTPEEAGMPLLAIPFTPNLYEFMYLSSTRILSDQMEYLKTRFSGNRDWVEVG